MLMTFPQFFIIIQKFLLPKIQSLDFSSIEDFYIFHINKVYNKSESVIQISSIGAGNCETEIDLAAKLIKKGIVDFSFCCIDINPYMLERGKLLAEKHHLISKLNFLNTDINNWQPDNKYHIIMASFSSPLNRCPPQ